MKSRRRRLDGPVWRLKSQAIRTEDGSSAAGSNRRCLQRLAVVGRDLILRFWRNIWSRREKLKQSLWAASHRSLADIRIGISHRHSLRKNGGHKMLNGNTFFPGEKFDSAPDGIRNGNAQGAHGDERIRRNWPGVTTAIPKAATPSKSSWLKVTMWLAPAARAHSKTRSSLGSRRNGRQRK